MRTAAVLIFIILLVVRSCGTLGYNLWNLLSLQKAFNNTLSYTSSCRIMLHEESKKEHFAYYDASKIESKENTDLIMSYRAMVVNNVTKSVQKFLPSPHSELLLGLVLGSNDIKRNEKYYDILIRTGTVHVVVVSGYNITLVSNMVISMLGTRYKLHNFLLAVFITLIYTGLAGFEPPVVRAWIMGTIASAGKYYGRIIDVKEILIVASYFMLITDPKLIMSLSFQLSLAATFSLIVYGDVVQKIFKKFWHIRNIVFENLCTTVAAQVLVWPLISYNFGRISVISPFVNALVLWTVPLSTTLGFLFILLSLVVPGVAEPAANIIFVPLDIFVRVTDLFSKIKDADLGYQIGRQAMLLYYSGVLVIPFLYKRIFEKECISDHSR